MAQGKRSRSLTKREFLFLAIKGLFVFPFFSLFRYGGGKAWAQMATKGLVRPRLASHFRTIEGGNCICELCPRRCRISEGKRGFCRVRENRGGKLYTLVYGNPCAFYLDPVERTPFFHVLPSTKTLSIATAGCNFHCKFCQTWEISQASPDDVYSYDIPPDRVVRRAKQMGARSISYTFVEPVIFYEYMMDASAMARKDGLVNLVHSNGYIQREPLLGLCRVMDAFNIDLKGFREEFYDEVCGGRLSNVLETIREIKREDIHLELTNLIIPTKNDDPSLIREMCIWIKKELGASTPVHFLRFYPLYKLRNLPPTTVQTLEMARSVALSAGLKYVYIGNVPGHEGENTFCPRCRRLLIQRTGYMVGEVNLKGGRCSYCGNPVPGIWT